MKMKKRKIEHSFDMLRILADENRLTILGLLAENKELCARDILEHLDISQPTLSHHMSVLLENHLVEARKSGRWVFYRVSGESIQELIVFLKGLKGELSLSEKEEGASVIKPPSPKKEKTAVLPKIRFRVPEPTFSEALEKNAVDKEENDGEKKKKKKKDGKSKKKKKKK